MESIFDRDPVRELRAGTVPVLYFAFMGERIFVIEPPDGAARGNLLWIHGLTDHAARQFDSAVRLAKLGYRTILFDLKGHGGRDVGLEESWWLKEAYLENPAQPESIIELIRRRESKQPLLSTSVREAEYRTLLRTTIDDHFSQMDRVFTQLLASRWNSVPLFLAGHSMGGLICVEGIRRFRLGTRANLAGLILIAPAFRPIGRPGRRAENALVDGFWGLSNRRSPLSLFRPLAKRVLDLNFAVDVSWGIPHLSDEDQENELFDRDPLNLKKIPSAYISSIESQLVRTNQSKLDFLPSTLMLLPQHDAIVNTAGSLAFAERARGAIGPDQLSVERFPYLNAHILLRISVRTQAENLISDWLEERSA